MTITVCSEAGFTIKNYEQKPHEKLYQLWQRFTENYLPEDGDIIKCEGYDIEYDD